MAFRTVVKVQGEARALALTDCLSNWKRRPMRGGWYKIVLQNHSEQDVRDIAADLQIPYYAISVRTVQS